MTRRRDRQGDYRNSPSRAERIAKLIAEQWIKDASEIPATAIPVDPHRLNLGGSYHRPAFYEDLEFTCKDCGTDQVWSAEDQASYYESSGAPYYSTAVRCRSCRIKERERKAAARKAAGHEKK